MSKKNKIIVICLIVVISISSIFGVLFGLGVFSKHDEPPSSPPVDETPSDSSNTPSQTNKVRSISSVNFENRIYVKNSGLYGDESLILKYNNNQKNTVKLTTEHLKHFNTQTIGKKYAQVKIDDCVKEFCYYVVENINDSRFNCISMVKNMFLTYYVNESINLQGASIEFCENKNGYITKTNVPVTEAMVSNFNTSTTGVKKLKINYNNYDYYVDYNVKQANSEVFNSNNFDRVNFYSTATVEHTAHFVIKIEANTFVHADYKQKIEEIYDIQQQCSGLTFEPKITIELNNTNYPSCAGRTIYMNSYALFMTQSTAFPHELAHALDHSQVGGLSYNGTLTEGFAQYMEYLTAKTISQTKPELQTYIGRGEEVVYNIPVLKSTMHFYSFEDDLLNLSRDQYGANSQYEAGARFYAYLDYKYDDFCGWMQDARFATSNLETLKALLKEYYNNNDLFNDFYLTEQQLGDRRNVLCGNDTFVEYATGNRYEMFANTNKFNWYFNMSIAEDFRGNFNVVYKDLYINIDSARNQLALLDLPYNNLKLKTNKHIQIECYNSLGNIAQVVSNTTTQFSLDGVSYIKLVGMGLVQLDFSYL